MTCEHGTCRALMREDTQSRADAERQGSQTRRFVCAAGHSAYLHAMATRREPPERVCCRCGDPFEPPPHMPYARKCNACVNPDYRAYARGR